VAVVNKGRLLAVGTPGELARDLWSARWLDIELQTVAQPTVLDALRSMDWIHEVVSDDTHLALQIANDSMTPLVVAEIVRLGGQIMRVNPREHSLEEIYFELQKRQG
jgi:ABC-2 type transport system ATP-binding protein